VQAQQTEIKDKSGLTRGVASDKITIYFLSAKKHIKNE